MIPVNEPWLIGNEKKNLIECIDTNWISSEGKFIREFEANFSKLHGMDYGIAVCNGSAALDVAMAALDLKVGDEVIMPSFTIISCAQSVVKMGAVPVLVDIDPISWNMDVNQVEARITKKTRAIMAVHMYGLPVDLDPLVSICEKYGLILVEDAAEAIGIKYKRKLCGSFGHLNVFSFFSNKHITTGEGGMVLTNNSELAERSRSFRNLCFKKERRFVHDELGWNYRMTNMQAAVGCAQLEYLEKSVQKKKRIGDFYQNALRDIGILTRPLSETSYATNGYWIFGLVINDKNWGDATKAMALLRQEGVDSRPFFWPMHEQPVFNKMGLFKEEKYPHSEYIARQGFYIPNGLGIRDEQLEEVVLKMRKIFL